ncbi:exodeoxyribonuclease-3 [Actinopolymorpha cephalotaxi]|uniref:Exodeoxyribonuclease-3 n=1 Tax=Actinopolymorpha cephalotaxi TaxID=504797 RepID=A0A1I2XBK6_9ACTN|nr:exodeoxyribonuclease III [Actinopolymorpha cephalotaxi]NYH86159.1 exodeoxyribonuclease-3 [Actinopolymorpha cephalotaxi]SFH10782.1 exodeoxyribonuclease-3 [Actinopolymorpha cephalotaxi]
MRFATWNVNSVGARLPRLEQWLDLAQPDVLCLQETKCAGDAFPSEGAVQRGYQVAAHGEGRWNGVAILSRVGLEQISRGFPGEPLAPPAQADGDPTLLEVPGSSAPEARAIGATCGSLRVWSVYVPNGRTLDSPQFPYKLAWLAALRAAVEPEVRSGDPFVIAGDFNVAPTDEDVWDPSAFIGSTHVTDDERRELADLRALGLEDVRPRALKHGTPYTYWDYRAGMFHKNQGMRIDLVYASRPEASRVTDAYVDREARKGKGPSDHAPIVVDLDL